MAFNYITKVKGLFCFPKGSSAQFDGICFSFAKADNDLGLWPPGSKPVST
jgi:hypothetical protein